MLINQRVSINKKLRTMQSKVIGVFVKWLTLKVQRTGRKLSQEFPYVMRVLIAEIVPDCPLEVSQKEVTALSVMVPCIEKDKLVLPLCLLGIQTNVLNKVPKITVVTDDDYFVPVYYGNNLQVINENAVLSDVFVQLLEKHVPPDRRGWVTKQILTFKFAYESSEEYILVIDADTVLTKPRLFVHNGKQILIPVVEYNDYDSLTTKLTWGKKGYPFGISFTSHHLVLQTQMVREMFDEIGGLYEGIKKWLESANSNVWSPISDMHSYGTWMLNSHPDRVVFARWGNFRASKTFLKSYIGLDPKDIFNQVVTRFKNYNSISFHHYLVDDYMDPE
jgi:hypothetical protein